MRNFSRVDFFYFSSWSFKVTHVAADITTDTEILERKSTDFPTNAVF